MAALTITATDVTIGLDARQQGGKLGATVTAGQPVYADGTADFKLKPAANTSEAAASVTGIALSGGGDNQVTSHQQRGTLDIGGVATEGVVYVLGGAGEIVPVADLTTGNWVTLIGTGDADGNLKLHIIPTNTQVQ